MKSLANFVIHSPANAALVAALATASLIFSWVGAAVVALYTLRFGFNAARLVLIAGLIPALVWVYQGDIGPVLTHVGVVTLAVLLRWRADWSLVLTAIAFVYIVLCFLVLQIAPDYVQQLQMLMSEFVEQFKAQMLSNEGLDSQAIERIQSMAAPTSESLMGMMALLQSVTAMFSLLLARWWQATLFNPGGFMLEFHQVRLTRVQAVALVASFVLLSGVEGFGFWAWLFLVAPVVAGLAMVHGVVSVASLGSRWLLLFYAALFLFRPTMTLLVVLAVLDSALDFRGRLRSRMQD